jgi:hypothetical protein
VAAQQGFEDGAQRTNAVDSRLARSRTTKVGRRSAG